MYKLARPLHPRALRLPAPTRPHLPRSSPLQRRAYSQSQRDRQAVGVFTPASAALFVAVGTGLFFYFRHEKAKLAEAREKERAASQVGRAHVGGPFALTTHTGAPFTDADLRGKWSLVYFGFTHCPDICPAELDKIGAALEPLEAAHGQVFLPLFVSVDPARDPPAQLAAYLKDFHPRVVGLTGSFAATKAVCKAYRVYFSTPPDADPEGDYLVDHSVFVYLMDPRGEFVDAFPQAVTAPELAERVSTAMKEWAARGEPPARAG